MPMVPAAMIYFKARLANVEVSATDIARESI